MKDSLSTGSRHRLRICRHACLDELRLPGFSYCTLASGSRPWAIAMDAGVQPDCQFLNQSLDLNESSLPLISVWPLASYPPAISAFLFQAAPKTSHASTGIHSHCAHGLLFTCSLNDCSGLFKLSDQPCALLSRRWPLAARCSRLSWWHGSQTVACGCLTELMDCHRLALLDHFVAQLGSLVDISASH